MHFNSTHEAYTHLLIKLKELEDLQDKIKVDMDYLLMNIRKGNFDSKQDKAHAVKELTYLVVSANKLSNKAGDMAEMSQHLLNDLL